MATAIMRTPDPARIARLQAQAARNPALYRWRLTLIAVAGDLALTALQVFPWVVPIFIGLLFYNYPHKFWLGAAATVLLAWLLRPSFRFDGREVKPEGAPRLFAEIAELRKKIDAPGEMRVMLDAEFNASAAETRGILGLFGTRSVLTLGIPLLAALSREQVLAVIAHELGHFSRRHGRLGHWLYRARVGWLAYAYDVGQSDSALDRAAAWYAEQFVPYFSTLSFVHSRQCEYEADSAGASAVGSRTFAEALTGLVAFGRVWADGFQREVIRWKHEMPEAPPDFYQRFSAAARKWPRAELNDWLTEELGTRSGWLDTHPSLAERLAPLHEEPRLAEVHSNAGSDLLGNTWETVLAEFNAEWLGRERVDWSIEHLRYKHVLQPLLAADAVSVTRWPEHARLARARALRVLQPAEGIADLRALHGQYPSNAEIAFAYGAALLREKDGTGAALLEKLAKGDARYRAPAYARLQAYYQREGNDEQAELWMLHAIRAGERRAAAVSEFMTDARLINASQSSLSSAIQTVLAEVIERDPCVVGSCLIEGEMPLATNESATAVTLRIHVLLLLIDTAKLQGSGSDEADVLERYERALDLLIAPHDQGIVRTYLTTETIPPELKLRLTRQ
ncbi:MAG TPA: M48 family metallopeptidase [Burkholderiales bacterium]|nr:M48 family metallopeptidase [Burkholderiales bacterium]